jgi:CheY-like chemotaxis protein
MDQSNTILVVEDDVLAREALIDLLQVEGYDVVGASDGQEGLNFLCASLPLPFVVLLDLGLPIIDGFEFLRRQKDDPEIAHVPVIIVTGTPSPDVPGATAILKKPVDAEKLIELLVQYR